MNSDSYKERLKAGWERLNTSHILHTLSIVCSPRTQVVIKSSFSHTAVIPSYFHAANCLHWAWPLSGQWWRAVSSGPPSYMGARKWAVPSCGAASALLPSQWSKGGCSCRSWDTWAASRKWELEVSLRLTEWAGISGSLLKLYWERRGSRWRLQWRFSSP